MKYVLIPNMQQNQYYPNLYFLKVYFCVCNFLSTFTIFLLFNILKSYKGLGDYKIFNRTFPFASLSYLNS